MATKSTIGKANGSDRDAALKSRERMFRVRLGKDQILTVRLSLGSAPVGGKGPRPKKDDLLLMLAAVVTESIASTSPKPRKAEPQQKKFIAKALVGGKGRKRPGGSP